MGNSILSDYTAVSSQMTTVKTNTMSTLLGGNEDAGTLTENILSATSDAATIFTISRTLATVASAAEDDGASEEALENLGAFASDLQEIGYDPVPVVTYLGWAQDVAETDIDEFNDIFGNSYNNGDSALVDIEALINEKTGDTDAT